MRCANVISAVVASELSLTAVLAQDTGRPCTIEAAVSQVLQYDLDFEARASQEALANLDELKRINAKAKNQNIPLSKQLSARDASRFTELSNRLKSIQISDLVESDHSRDATIVRKMYDAAWKSYQDEKYTPNGEDFAGNLVVSLRVLFHNVDVESNWNWSNNCSVDDALHVTLADAFKRMASYDPIVAQNQTILRAYPVNADTH